MKILPKILLVDDERRFIDSLESILKHYNYECFKAYSGKEAVALLENESFHLALLDVELPDMSGCDVAKLINTKYSTTTVIMLTGVNTVEIAVQSMKYGAYDFLRKPLDYEQLLKTIEKGLRNHLLEKELQTSEQRFKILAEVAWECILVHSDGHIVEANAQLQDMLGYSSEDLMLEGLHLGLIISPRTSLESKQNIIEGIEGSCTGWAIKKNGEEIAVEVKSRSINYLGKIRKVCVIRDISERKRAEEENLELQKKLASANKLNALGLMAGSIAHDLNNILTGIVSYPDMLLMQMETSDKSYGQIRKIQEAGKRAAAVVSDLVAITRGREQPKKTGDLNTIVLRYLNSLEHEERLADFPNIVISTKLQRDIKKVLCSQQHMHKVLLNLIGNALEALRDGGHISVTTENCLFRHPLLDNVEGAESTEYVKMTIADDGHGISDNDVEHIFDPFYTTKVMGKSGSGLGLSIVWNIIQDHDGWIELKDNDPGAIFELYIPALKQPCKTGHHEETQHKPISGNGETILIIDDQHEQNEMFEKTLGALGYKTHSVTSGEDGLVFLKNNSADLVLLDMIMGNGMGGRETLEQIRMDKPDQKTVIISGFARMEELEKTKALGVSAFLEKPVSVAKLSRTIEKSLKEGFSMPNNG